ncbi:MAG: KH domain-containing protein [Bacilli bacterium]
MKLVELTEFLVKSIVSDPDSILIKQFEDEDLITIEIIVKEEDMGIVIGKGGSIINSIRAIVQASSFVNNLKHVQLNVDSF